MRTTGPAHRGRLVVVALVGLGLIGVACNNKKNDSTAATTTTASGGTTASTTPGTGSVKDTTAVTDTTAPKKKPVPGGSITVAGESEVSSPWTPAAMQCDSYCYERARSFYDELLVVTADRKAAGMLVESFSANSDSTVWTFKLRSGIKFTDGTPMNADAAIYNLQKTGTSLLISAAVKDIGKNPDKSLAIEKVDDLTFTIKTGFNGDLSKPVSWPDMPLSLTGQIALIASPTWLKAVEAKTADPTKPVGTGPFIVQSYAANDKLVVTRNPDYWMKDADGNKLPYLDGVTFRVIADGPTSGSALQSGQLDAFSTSDAGVVADFRTQADQFPMSEQTNFTSTNYLLIDEAKVGPLQDSRVRCALSLAINRQEMIDAIYGGITKPANGVFSPGQQGYLDDNGGSTAFDVEKAKGLIADYKKDHPGAINVNYGTTTSTTNTKRADMLKGYWSAIGVDMTYQQVPQDEFITDALFGKPNFFVFGWRQHDGLVVDQQYFWWHSNGAGDGALSLNFARINDPIVDKDLETARSAATRAERDKAAEDLNRQMAKMCYQIPIDWTIWGIPHKKNLVGFGELVLADGSKVLDGAGWGGQYWLQTLWIDKSA